MKKIIILCSCVLLIGAVAAHFILNYNKGVEKFNMEDYQKYIDHYSSMPPFALEPVTDSTNLKTQIEVLWTEMYGKEHVESKKPFDVFYDAANDAWLIEEPLPPGYLGGGAHMIILSNGTVLAFWGDK